MENTDVQIQNVTVFVNRCGVGKIDFGFAETVIMKKKGGEYT